MIAQAQPIMVSPLEQKIIDQLIDDVVWTQMVARKRDEE